MSDPGRPCPMHVVHDGRKTYCEQGHKGHWGTCFGTKSEWQYRAELKAWRERNTKTTDTKDNA